MRKSTLGPNINPQGGGMMAAMGLAAPQPPAPALAEATPDLINTRSPRRERSRPTASPTTGPPHDDAPEMPTSSPAPIARVPTDISRATLDLARRAAYWNRDTLRAFLERAIVAEAARVAETSNLAELPEAPPLKPGRRPQRV
jgi:hypothetical protein